MLHFVNFISKYQLHHFPHHIKTTLFISIFTFLVPYTCKHSEQDLSPFRSTVHVACPCIDFYKILQFSSNLLFICRFCFPFSCFCDQQITPNCLPRPWTQHVKNDLVAEVILSQALNIKTEENNIPNSRKEQFLTVTRSYIINIYKFDKHVRE